MQRCIRFSSSCINLHAFVELQLVDIRKHHTRSALDQRDFDNQASVYVHWPYCLRRCTYCNFNKYISKNVDEERMRDCLVRETKTLLDLTKFKRIRSVYFGGGTPSLASPSTLGAVIEAICERADLQADAEITLEVNPNGMEIEKLRDFKNIGVNRVSLGIQALNNNDLKVLGRDHSKDEAQRSIHGASDLFPGRTSIDLIFGRPGQLVTSWLSELQQALDNCDDHISLYQLTLERGTALFKDVQLGRLSVPDENVMADMYESTQQLLSEHSFVRYEASNFARNGAASEHNQWYWAGGQYIGIGPGAHGRFTPYDHKELETRIQTLEPIPWMREVEKYGHATRKSTILSHLERLEEVLMLGLRTSEGIPVERWKYFSPKIGLHDIFSSTIKIHELQERDLLIMDDRGLRCTDRGLNVVDSITPLLLFGLHQKFESQINST